MLMCRWKNLSKPDRIGKDLYDAFFNSGQDSLDRVYQCESSLSSFRGRQPNKPFCEQHHIPDAILVAYSGLDEPYATFEVIYVSSSTTLRESTDGLGPGRPAVHFVRTVSGI